MTEDARRLKVVRVAIETLVKNGASSFRPGDVASHQRTLGDPIPVWELRAIFADLSKQGIIQLDATTGNWSLKAGGESVAAG